MTWDGQDRRTMGDFEKEMLVLMGEVRQYMKAQPGRCDAHGAEIKAIKGALNGNGSMGIKTKLVVIYISIGVLALAVGADHPWVLKLMSRFGGLK